MTTLKQVIDEYGDQAYLITGSELGPHTSYVSVELTESGLKCAIGGSALRNISVQPLVSLLWHPDRRGDYSIIVNAKALLYEESGSQWCNLELSKAVFHRPGPRPKGGLSPCTSDCKPIML